MNEKWTNPTDSLLKLYQLGLVMSIGPSVYKASTTVLQIMNATIKNTETFLLKIN